MKTHRAKILSAAVIAAALVATVAIARTVHTRVPASADAPAQHSAMSSGNGTAARAPLHGSVACGGMSYHECQKLELMLPM
jgi:hypothetical protein